jgi:hypothetical protein
MRIKVKWDVIKRFKLFIMSSILFLVGVVIQEIFFPNITPSQPYLLMGIGQIPVIVYVFVILATLCFGAGFAEDYYRCKYDDKPYIFFQKKDDMDRDIKKYPITKFWYKLTGQLEE